MERKCTWLTGVPSAGKSTIGAVLQAAAQARGIPALLLDADYIRDPRLGFSEEDRMTNVLQIADRACDALIAGGTVIVACIAPSAKMKDAVTEHFEKRCGRGVLNWAWLYASKEACIARDSRGLYARAQAGEITGLTGYDAPYEPPLFCPVFNTEVEGIGYIVEALLPPRRKYAVYIGRWSPFHNGHYAIIKRSLDAGENVHIMVRDSIDGFSVGDRLRMIRLVFAGDPRVVVSKIPDVAAVCYGRGVGYEVREYTMPDDVEGISATSIRKAIAEGSSAWRMYVPSAVAKVIAL